MFKIKSSINFLPKVFSSFPRRSYQTLTAENYLYNQRDATLSKEIHMKSLFPLPKSNHSEGTTDEIILYGIPKGQVNEDPHRDILTSAMEANHPDLVFLQMNPEPWIARQRFMAHKSALKGVEDYEINGLEQMDPTVPHSWEECVVNLVVLDSLRQNKVHTELFFPDGVACYSYPFLQEPEITKSLTVPFINAITEHVVNEDFSEYNIINQALYTSLMGKHKVILGEMPELLLRRKLGNAIPIGELRDLFKFVIGKMNDLKTPITMREATLNFLPHVFLLPKDLYMTALLKEAFQAATCITAFVGLSHFNPIQEYWIPPPEGINFSEATRINDRIKGETDLEQIEKQAIMDVMLGTRAWGKRYVSNPFPYLVDDITKVNDEELYKLKKSFLVNLKKYESFRDKNVKTLEGGQQPGNLFITETMKGQEGKAQKKKIFY